jgi:anti-anti-sigma factor
MEITRTKKSAVDIFSLNGKLDVSGSQKANDEILPNIPQGGKLVIDMSGCGYVASSGLRILLLTAKQSSVVNCKTVLAGVHPMVWDVIVMTGFEDILESYATVDEAVAVLA